MNCTICSCKRFYRSVTNGYKCVCGHLESDHE